MSTVAQKLFDATVRADHVIWVPSAVADPEGLPEVFIEEFCDWLPEKSDHAFYDSLPELRQFAGEMPDTFEVAFALTRRDGFLVQAATPVMKAVEGGSFHHYGWGHYRTCWLYVDKHEDLPSALLTWAEGCRDLERSQLAARSNRGEEDNG